MCATCCFHFPFTLAGIPWRRLARWRVLSTGKHQAASLHRIAARAETGEQVVLSTLAEEAHEQQAEGVEQRRNSKQEDEDGALVLVSIAGKMSVLQRNPECEIQVYMLRRWTGREVGSAHVTQCIGSFSERLIGR